MRALWFTLFAASGACLGWAGEGVYARLALRAPPPGWAVHHPRIPAFAAVDQPLPEGRGWSVQDHAELRGRGDAVEADVQLPPGGTLDVGLDLGRGFVGIHLDRGDTPSARAFLRTGPSGRWLDCDGALPPPGDAPVYVAVRSSGSGLGASVDGHAIRCDTGPISPRAPALRGGLLRVLVRSLNGAVAPVGGGWTRAAAVGLGAALGLAVGAWARRRALRLAPLAAVPLLAAPALLQVDARALTQALRVQADEPLLWVLGAPLGLTLALAAAIGAGALARSRPWAALALGAATGAAVAAAAGPAAPLAGVAAAGVGLAVAGVVVLNVRRPPGFNVASLALVLGAAGVAELGLRQTATGRSWASVSGREAAALADEHDALTRRRVFTTYPTSGYPVRPPPRSAPLRIVAFGGSSTGGAFTNDDLDAFWPALLERQLGAGVQVVNQGVGGWTTLHIRRYVETALPPVDPDIAVLYIGHNDRFTPSPVPYATLFGALDRRPAASVSRALSGVRLYQGLRFGLSALVGRPAGEAVPLADARDNLVAIVAALRDAGARVLLIREGLAVGGSLLAPYGRMLCSLEAPDVGCLDVASALEDPLAERAFLDNVHLNPGGHARVAEGVAAELRRRGWLAEAAP